MMVEAPGLLSMTTGLPRRVDSFWPSARATASVPPRGGKGATRRTVRWGHASEGAAVWARDSVLALALAKVARTADSKETRTRLFMQAPEDDARGGGRAGAKGSKMNPTAMGELEP